mmetsp:Transcript_51718/g.143199  ORF Transcript_51718/g.143199 Transcript_51718/m.143199 type:complete len:83 (-) Transcript_51718:692-940(-)
MLLEVSRQDYLRNLPPGPLRLTKAAGCRPRRFAVEVRCPTRLPVRGSTNPCKSLVHLQRREPVSTARHLKQNLVPQFKHIIL